MKITHIFVLINVFCFGQNYTEESFSQITPNTNFISTYETNYEFLIKQYTDKTTKKLYLDEGLEFRKRNSGIKTESFDLLTSFKNIDSLNRLPATFKFKNFTYLGKINGRGQERKQDFKTMELRGDFNINNEFIIDKIFIDNKRTFEEFQMNRIIKDVNLIPILLNSNLEVGTTTVFNKTIDLSDKMIFYESIPKSKTILSKRIFTLVKIKNNIAYFKIRESLISNKDKFENTKVKVNTKGNLKVDIISRFALTLDTKSSLIIHENNHLGNKRKSVYKETIKSISTKL